jgi:hypothetical protein
VKKSAEVTMKAPSPTELASWARARFRGAPAGGRSPAVRRIAVGFITVSRLGWFGSLARA